VNAIHRVDAWEVGLPHLGHHYVIGIDHVRDGRLHRLRYELIRVHRREPGEFGHPMDRLDVANAKGIFEWLRRTGRHDLFIALNSRPPDRREILDHVDDPDGIRGRLEGHAARLALALARVSVSEVEEAPSTLTPR
jgi:hypothetical protein